MPLRNARSHRNILHQVLQSQLVARHLPWVQNLARIKNQSFIIRVEDIVVGIRSRSLGAVKSRAHTQAVQGLAICNSVFLSSDHQS
jgi:hypothetical protein